MTYTKSNLHDKIVLITGGTDGLGKATAIGLARLGATVVIVGRNRHKGEAVVAEIKSVTGNDQVELMLADLTSQAAIHQLAGEFTARYRQLHVLINNAGVFQNERVTTRDGLETTFAVNYLAPFLLTNLLLPMLKASTHARIINVGSQAHEFATMDFDDLQGAQRYRAFRGAYAQSKLALVLFTYELAYRLAGTGVTANVADPGGVKTNMSPPGVFKLLRPFFATPEQAAATSIFLATAPELASVSGQYYRKQQAVASSKASHDEAAARRLWEVSERLTNLAHADAMSAVRTVVSSDTTTVATHGR